MKQTILALAFVAIAFASCKEQKETPVTDETTTTEVVEQPTQEPTGDNAQTSLDWEGTYKGTLPCQDCEGIATVITLNKDGVFTATTEFKGKKEAAETIEGKFSWDESGSKITLATATGGVMGVYAVNEGSITNVDVLGENMTSEEKASYTLVKQ